MTIVKDDLTNSTSLPLYGECPAFAEQLNLCDRAVTGCVSSQSFPFLPTGSYTVDENKPIGWTLDTIVCTGSTSSFSYTPTGATINLQPGDNVTCKFTNSRDTGSLKITKSVTGDVPPSFSQTFNFAVACTLSGNPDLNYNLSINYPTNIQLHRVASQPATAVR